MKKSIGTVLLFLILAFASAQGQEAVIKFPPNAPPATVKGHVNPLSSKTYQLTVSANQQIAIHLASTSRKKLVRFSISRNRYSGQPLTGAKDVADWEGTLKEAGDYWIGVFALPNADEENFTLVISTPAPAATEGNPA